jgi:hypothetical protein
MSRKKTNRISYGKFNFQETTELIPLLIQFLRSSEKNKKGNFNAYDSGETTVDMALKLEGCKILEMVTVRLPDEL